MGTWVKAGIVALLGLTTVSAFAYYGRSGSLDAASGLQLVGAAVAEEAALRRALEENPYDIEAWMSLGDLYQENRRLPEALEAFERAVQISAGDPSAILKASLVEIRLGRVDEAETRVLLLLESHPVDSEALKVMGWIAVHRSLKGASNIDGLFPDQEYLTAADGRFRAALRIAPDNAEAFVGRAVVARLEHRDVDALRLTEEAAERDSQVYWAWQIMGEVLMDLGRDSEAADAFGRAQALGQGRSYTLMELAELARRARHPDAAAELMQRVGPEGAYSRGVDLLAAGRGIEAEAAFMEALLNDPEDDIALDRLEAVRLTLYPADDTRRLELAQRRLVRAARAEAVNNALLAYLNYRRAVVLAPQLSESRLRMARFFDHQGSFSAAVMQLKRVEELTRSQNERLVASDLLEVVTRKALTEMETTHQVRFGALWEQPTSVLGTLIGNPEVLEEKIRWSVTPVPRPRLKVVLLPFVEALSPFHVGIGRLATEWVSRTLGLLPGFELVGGEVVDSALVRFGAASADAVDPGRFGKMVGADLVVRGRILEAREDVTLQVAAIQVPSGPVIWQREYTVRGPESLMRAVLEIARTLADGAPLEGAVVRRHGQGTFTINLGRIHGIRAGDTVTVQRRGPELLAPGFDWPGRREENIAQGRVIALTERYAEVQLVAPSGGAPLLDRSGAAIRAGDIVRRRR